MWKNAIVATTVVLMGILIALAGVLDFLSPYKSVLFHQYGGAIAIYFTLLAVNLYAGFFLLTRFLFLKDTGKKLVHLEKQLRDGSIPHDLGDRLTAEE
jgi:hypothetical protein